MSYRIAFILAQQNDYIQLLRRKETVAILKVMNIKIIILSISVLLTIGFVTTTFHTPGKDEVYAYVCGQSKIYHLAKSHQALKRCKKGITKMTLSNAKSLGKRACKCRSQK